MNSETKPKDVRTWIEISKSALQHNYGLFRGHIPKACRLMAVAKSNAYGHGFIEYAKALEDMGVDWFGMDSISEASALRDEGIEKPILVLGYTLPERFSEAVVGKVSITISTFEGLAALEELSRKGPIPKIHLKLDTGMHRQGFLAADCAEVILRLKKLPAGTVEGIYTHFASAKDPKAPEETQMQLQQFLESLKAFTDAGFAYIRHAAATGGALLFPNTQLDMVRVGIGLYGLWPSAEIEAHLAGVFALQPILSWKTIISEIKSLPAGARVGYDFTETLSRPSRVAVCPIGYWHGYARALSSKGRVMVAGSCAKVLGRVSMDMIIIDITDIKSAEVGAEVTLIGQNDAVTADAMAKSCGTTNYEIVTRLNPLMRKVYID